MGCNKCAPVLSGGRMDFTGRMQGFRPIESMGFSFVEPLCSGHRVAFRVFHFEEWGVFGSFNSAGSNGFKHIVLGLLWTDL